MTPSRHDRKLLTGMLNLYTKNNNKLIRLMFTGNSCSPGSPTHIVLFESILIKILTLVILSCLQADCVYSFAFKYVCLSLFNHQINNIDLFERLHYNPCIIIIVARLRLDLFFKTKHWFEKTFLKGSEQMVTKHPVQL